MAMLAFNVTPAMVMMARDAGRGVVDRFRSMPITRVAIPFGQATVLATRGSPYCKRYSYHGALTDTPGPAPKAPNPNVNLTRTRKGTRCGDDEQRGARLPQGARRGCGLRARRAVARLRKRILNCDAKTLYAARSWRLPRRRSMRSHAQTPHRPSPRLLVAPGSDLTPLGNNRLGHHPGRWWAR
jgi:hypothetical protein